MADVANRVDRLEEDVKEQKGSLEEMHGRLDEHSENITRILKWGLTGNGDSAETRLHSVETNMGAVKMLVDKVVSDESIARIAQVAVEKVIGNARTKDRTFVSKVRAFALWFAPACLLVSTILTLILKK